MRRNRLSEELNTIELEKRHQVKTRRAELDLLQSQLAAKDVEVQSLRDEQDLSIRLDSETGIVRPTTTAALDAKVHELEQEIRDLQAKLGRRQAGDEADSVDWTLAARDPYTFAADEDDNMATNYDFDMDDTEIITTPTRLNTSFPSPPSTTPNTPSRFELSVDVGTQSSPLLPDQENLRLKAQLQSLQTELQNLNTSILLKDNHQDRLISKLSEFLPLDEVHDHSTLDAALDKVLTTLALSQSQCIENTHAFSALSNCVTSLGFTASSPDAALEIINSQFRAARLELEYLIPGETTAGFENSKLLELLIGRLKTLVSRVHELDNHVDQYHEQEINLRQQLNVRVDVMDALKDELRQVKSELGDKDISIERLQAALTGYRQEVESLEGLIGRIENEGKEVEHQLRSEIQEAQDRLQDETLKHDITRADNEGKDVLLIELERRLSAVLDSVTKLESKITILSSTIVEQENKIDTMCTRSITREKEHGSALALRDARVAELRQEIDRVNDTLKTAHNTILKLRNNSSSLEEQLDSEKSRGFLAVQAMRDQLSRALDTGTGYVRGEGSVARSERSISVIPETDHEQPKPVVRRGQFLDPSLARRKSGQMRRRYDSGMGFLEEDAIVHTEPDGGLSKEVADAVDAQF